MQDQNEYTTLDVGEAAALFCLNYEIIRLEKTGKGIQRAFIFSSKSTDSEYPDAAKTIDDYRRKRLSVEAYSFFIAQKEMKNRLHDEFTTSP